VAAAITVSLAGPPPAPWPPGDRNHPRSSRSAALTGIKDPFKLS